MWKPIYQPGPWPQFVKRKDIAPLPLMEQRKKHMEEQMLFENYVSSVNTMNVLNAGAAGGPAPGGYSFTALDDTNFNVAISEWFANQASAEAEYGPIGQWNTTAVNTMFAAFEGKTTFNEDIGAWDVSNVTTLERMFNNADAFNQNLNGWNTSKVTNLNNTFADTAAFNSPLNDWDVRAVTQVINMFSSATAFQQPLNNWKINSVFNVNGSLFMGNTGAASGIVYTGYDDLLIGWAANAGALRSNVTFSFGKSTFSAGAATTARGVLTDAAGLNWTITDGGQA